MSDNERLKITRAATRIGGLEIDYQPDPGVTVQIDPTVLNNPAKMLGLLGAMINMQDALVREVLALRGEVGTGSHDETPGTVTHSEAHTSEELLGP